MYLFCNVNVCICICDLFRFLWSGWSHQWHIFCLGSVLLGHLVCAMMPKTSLPPIESSLMQLADITCLCLYLCQVTSFFSRHWVRNLLFWSESRWKSWWLRLVRSFCNHRSYPLPLIHLIALISDGWRSDDDMSWWDG